MITVENLHVSYENQEVLGGVSFQVATGERVSLVGPGGSGKTTVFKAICGLVESSEGVSTVFGEELSHLSDKDKMRLMRRIGVAFQQGGLFDFMTVRENLEFAMSNLTSKDYYEQQRIIDNLLKSVKLARTKDMFPFELSGGMQRRVGLARALCTDPEVALFDEPTAGLDPVTSTIILNMIDSLGASRPSNTLMIATSNVEVAFRFAKRIIILKDGKIHADGNWQELLMAGDPWTKNFLSVRFVGLSKDYLRGLNIPQSFVEAHGI